MSLELILGPMFAGKERNHKGEVQEYLKQARKYDLDKIICLDETAIYANMHSSYARCDMGKRFLRLSSDREKSEEFLISAIFDILFWTTLNSFCRFNF